MFFRAAVLALPFVAQALAEKQCARTYTVKEGEICDGISAANNVSTYQLSAVNPSINDNCTNLVPGSQLCLGYTGEDCSTTYTVVLDDSCEQIAANHKINSTMLYSNNPQLDETDCSNLYVGEVLCVGGTVEAPPTPSGHMPGAVIPTTAAPANPSAGKTHTQTATSYLEVTSTAPTPAPTSSPASAPPPAPTSAPTTGGGDDDDDLPFCDEL